VRAIEDVFGDAHQAVMDAGATQASVAAWAAHILADVVLWADSPKNIHDFWEASCDAAHPTYHPTLMRVDPNEARWQLTQTLEALL